LDSTRQLVCTIFRPLNAVGDSAARCPCHQLAKRYFGVRVKFSFTQPVGMTGNEIHGDGEKLPAPSHHRRSIPSQPSATGGCGQHRKERPFARLPDRPGRKPIRHWMTAFCARAFLKRMTRHRALASKFPARFVSISQYDPVS